MKKFKCNKLIESYSVKLYTDAAHHIDIHISLLSVPWTDFHEDTIIPVSVPAFRCINIPMGYMLHEQ